ncbi:bis(5'-nucleosyl)-tetraphosphatase (symmetrical) YqeK [Butyrivibrio sp. AE2032]|uniref:bis(5'-nucleosyl)-tetraphosphatase (symmetrical) YqeK n=1 Tax=Butyrivibrio sp. AE2032 TaxID=1458463 RepID=UPI00068FA78A|nr:bis(5'-nucleosyl)-tetraphosphatase (symmetrical) YqeK [Butyrivibrio sp. AE2032]
MRIGVYGGSFDPVHNGHIAMIKSALKSGFIDCVIVIPSVRNSFKLYANKLPPPYRLYMMKETVEGLELKNVFVSDVEYGIEGVSYTAVVLAKLTSDEYIQGFLTANGVKRKKAEEHHEFFWIMGSDTLGTFETWYKPGEILNYASLLAAVRPGDDTDVDKAADSIRKNLGGRVEIFRLDGVDCSSSGITASGDFSMVPEPARDFIKLHALYTENTKLEGVSEDALKQFYESAVWMYHYLGAKRLLHTLNVGYLSAHLADVFGCDKNKALIAGALHDCAKELPLEEQSALARKYSGDLFTEKKLLHSPAGATFASEQFGIKDKEILDAICYHTTGKGGMSTLEKIVYLADKIEPARNYTDLSPIRAAAEKDLDSAMRMTAAAVRDKFVSQGRDIHPLTQLMMKDLGM